MAILPKILFCTRLLSLPLHLQKSTAQMNLILVYLIYYQAMSQKKWFLWFVYHHPLGYPFLFVFRTRIFSRIMGWIFRSSFSRALIRPLSSLYDISLDSYVTPEWWFRTLNDFFIRATKAEFRLFPRWLSLGSPADACVEIFPNISVSDYFFVKWYKAKFSDIFWPDIGDFAGGDVCFCRLRFSDYHRFHFFDDGEVLDSSGREGPLYSVDQSVLDTGLWIQNKSHLMKLKTKNFGEVLWLEVGATNVGCITNHKKSGENFSRWEEKWYFELGGSAILLVFQKDVIEWTNSLLQKTLWKEEYEVTAGDVIWRKI